MKRLSFALMLFVLACIGGEVYNYVESSSQAFEAYQKQATAMARENRHNPPFESLDGYIIDVKYIVVSMSHEGRNQIRLETVQAVHFQKGLPTLNWASRKVAKTGHNVLMTKIEGRWQIAELQEGITEVSGLSDMFDVE